MNVGIIMPVAEQRGGSEKYLLDMLRAGRDTEINWVVILLEDGPMRAQIAAMGIRVEVITAKKFSKIGQTIQATLRIKDFCRKNNIGMVIGWMTKGHIYGSISRLLGSPALPVHFQHGYANPPGGFDKLALSLPVAGVLACSRFVLDSQLALYKNKARGFVAYPGVAVDEYSPATLPSMEECRAKLGLPASVPVIGTVGRLQHWKGMHTLIDALPAIHAKHPDAHVVLVGGTHALEPDYEAFLQKRIADAGLQSHVRVTGFQSNIAEWMQAMSVFVHASNTEPFGIVVIEAMALGKPVIAGAQGGPREIITEGENGLLAGFEDANAVANGVLRYLDDPGWARQVGEKARVRAQDFSLAHCAEGVINAVRELGKK
ncbi:MAG: glycosyltransferase family 4 protein [Armatimonadetes bacterium]|nr:glycosyltransferase family 4 protein [Armatimonadota bacterium]